jgi:hypothetical protein
VFNAVPARAVQAALRRAFARWGRPARLRLDNGLPWGSWNDLPTALALWLVGLGVDPVFNPPRQPQCNGVVEKSQDTGQRWCEPGRCASAAELQRRLDEMDRVQREAYPSLGGRSRLVVFPQLAHSGRAYAPAREGRDWDLGRAQAYLAGFTAVRRANGQGQVSVYAHRHSVGTRHRGETVVVYYDPGPGEWVLTDTAGRVLRRPAAVEITSDRIRRLDLGARPDTRRGKT